ncbi:universal stress protein [Nonomuraea sp. bgisy101]|uniref:universal stress protein n=1 Tax=Nonomuraea sp. bgisy101 TaxID=3413784 RepID=UPI003D74FFE9
MSRGSTLKERESLPATDDAGTRRVVVGVDGSAAARDALTWAAEEAARRQAALVIVHAWESPSPYRAPYAPASVWVGPEWARDEGRALLDRMAAIASRVCPWSAVERRLVEGRPAEALLAAAEGADLLVLGARAQMAGDGRLGATVLACLRWPPCPVVMVPVVPLETAARSEPAASRLHGTCL